MIEKVNDFTVMIFIS